jgi:predicted AlkP superfamily phosphohydrolase/phosphomutase
MKGERPKVLIIGLDGATFDLIKPWAREGHLPNLKRLMETGSYGNLESTLPPVTAPAWASMVTGKNPAGHGCFDFTKQVDKATGHVGIVNSKSIRSKTLWSMLSEADIKIGSVNVPITYPPFEVNGFMISGMLSPNNTGVSYPGGLIQEMTDKSCSYRVDVSEKFREGREDVFLNDILSLTEEREKSSLWLMRNKPWDFFFVVFKATDYGTHFFWKYMDKNHPHYMGDNSGYNDAILRCYQISDEAVGKLVKEAGEDTTVFIVSDHGGGPLLKSVNLNIYLRRRGFLHMKRTFRTMLKRAMFRLGLSPDRVYGMVKVFRMERRVAKKSRRDTLNALSSKFLSFDDVDWPRTRAFSRGYLGQISINAKGEEYNRIRQEVIDALFEMKDPQTGEKIVTKVVKKEEAYSGKFINDAPDLVVIMQDYKYNSYPLFASSNSLVKPQIEGSSGHHKMQGVLIAEGPNIRSGHELPGSRIWDVCPTILHIYGISIPENMDGLVVQAIFSEGSEPSERKITYEHAGEENILKKSIEKLKISGKI